MSDRRWMVAAAAAVGLGLAAIPFIGTRAEQTAGAGASAGKPATGASAVCDPKAKKKAPDFELSDYMGKKVRLADYKGKVVFVNFWATWCGPCKYEIPMFVDLQQRYGAQGLSFLGISVDDPVEELKPFVDQYKINYPVLVGLGREEVQEAYGPMIGIPVTVVIGRDGDVCTRYFGLRPKDRFEADIKSLL
jgi:thiol-disulfide isomerase/thioredoxin